MKKIFPSISLYDHQSPVILEDLHGQRMDAFRVCVHRRDFLYRMIDEFPDNYLKRRFNRDYP